MQTPPPPTSGVSSFKVYMSYKNRMIRDNDVIRVFRETRRLGAVAMVHAENGDAICEVGPEAGRAQWWAGGGRREMEGRGGRGRRKGERGEGDERERGEREKNGDGRGRGWERGEGRS